jgi:addiction module HigA family antidote
MMKPPHPGTVILRDCIEAKGLTITEAAAALGVTRPGLSELVNGKRGVSPKMAVRLEKMLGQRRKLACATGAIRPRPCAPRPDQGETSSSWADSSLLPTRLSRSLGSMEVHFSPDVETRLQEVASANGKDAEQLVKDTVARMLENQARFIAGVQRGIEQADRGELVEHKEVLDRIDRLFHS